MKIMYTDLISAIDVSSANTSFPKTNLSNEYRGNYWKAAAGASTATVTLTVSEGSNAFGLSNTNASSVIVEVQDVSSSTIYGPTAHSIDTYKPDLWVNYTTQASACTILLSFSTPATAPYCGVVRAAAAYTFPNPNYGFSEGLYDTSIEKDLNNGTIYYKKRSIGRIFSGTIEVNRDTYFYTFMHTILMQAGKAPMFWYLTDNTNMDWVVFARAKVMPGGSHDYFTHSKISFSLVEDIIGLSE